MSAETIPASHVGGHTPGPWRVAPASAYPTSALVSIDAGPNGTRGFICEVGLRGEPMVEADARLIAAAPDMLAALQAINDAWCGPSMTPDEFFRFMAEQGPTIRAAIAKATGER